MAWEDVDQESIDRATKSIFPGANTGWAQAAVQAMQAGATPAAALNPQSAQSGQAAQSSKPASTSKTSTGPSSAGSPLRLSMPTKGFTKSERAWIQQLIDALNTAVAIKGRGVNISNSGSGQIINADDCGPCPS